MPFVVSSRGLCLTGQGSSHQTSSELLNTSLGRPVDTDTKNDENHYLKKSILDTENAVLRQFMITKCTKNVYDYKIVHLNLFQSLECIVGLVYDTCAELIK